MRALVSCLLLALVGCSSERIVRAPDGEAAGPAAGVTDLGGAWGYHVGDMPVPTQIAADAPRMRVPSNWYKEGVDASGVVWFFREVDLGSSTDPVAIHFGAVDYSADVFWDGEPIGSHRGYFAPFVAHVPEGRRAGKHVLAVRVDSPRETAASWSLHKTLIKGVLSHHDTRPGGAWSEQGQDANTGGIWGDVTIRAIKNAHIDALHVVTEEIGEGRARLRIALKASRLFAAATAHYAIRSPSGQLVASGEIGSLARDGEISTTVRIENPELWWPYEDGPSPRYSVRVELEGARGIDVAQESFGIRTVRRDENNRIVVNGTPIFLRGTNWIGSLYYASFSEEAIRKDVLLMKRAHVNAIRVHAHIASPAFYRVCDELGMMVWQDFPLQWGYDDSQDFADEAARQGREMVASLGEHASVIHWSSMNEAPFSSDWMVWKYKDYDPDQNRLLARVVRDAISAADPTRPTEGNAHPSEHAWSGWYEGKYQDFSRPTPHAILTEYGAQAVPALATLRTFLGPDELWPLTGKTLEKWEYHNFQMRETREIAKVPLGNSVEELVANTQNYQARLIQFAGENLRRQKWQPVTAAFQFMFVEHWASMNWGVVDYLRNPKPGYAALERAYQPVLPIVVRKPNARELTAYVINDLRRPLLGTHLVLRSGTRTHKILADVPANDVALVASTIQAPGATMPLELELLDANDRVLSSNSYAPGYFDQEQPK